MENPEDQVQEQSRGEKVSARIHLVCNFSPTLIQAGDRKLAHDAEQTKGDSEDVLEVRPAGCSREA